MNTFLFSYRAPKGYTPGNSETVAAWRAWFQQIDAHIADLGNPVFERTALGGDAADTVLGGYSLISADDLDQATALAQGCPLLELGGGVEVGMVTRLNRDDLSTTVEDHAEATSAV